MIPVIDVSGFLSGHESAARSAAVSIRNALEQVGFFYLVGHGIASPLIDRMYEQARRFHSLPEAPKMAVLGSPDVIGYIPVRASTSRASSIGGNVRKPNLVAGFAVAREYANGRAPSFSIGSVPDRVAWPDERVLPGFRVAVSHYCRVMDDLGQRLLPLYALALDLAPDYFLDAFVEGMWNFRLSQYAPAEPEEGQWGLAPHTDGGFLTLLPDNRISALEIRPATGNEWIPAPSIPGSILVNAGDTLHRWTNGRFLSTEHRVRASTDGYRYALPFFFGPNATALIEPLPTCVGPERPARWEPITYGEYYLWFSKQNYAAYAALETT
jgi:isopenicillin N synthase-like dioxygenase